MGMDTGLTLGLFFAQQVEGETGGYRTAGKCPVFFFLHVNLFKEIYGVIVCVGEEVWCM